jgi:1,4-dihydroxy-2-naphthoyl-CoA synthase
MELTDTRYEVENGLAWITIDRPDRMNAFRARTVDELIHLFTRAWSATDVGVLCLTGPAIGRSARAATRSSAPRRATTARASRGGSRSSGCTG